jgi:drug/metabolite transporter (DMT)-like permease
LKHIFSISDLYLFLFTTLGAGNYAAIKFAMPELPIYVIAAVRFTVSAVILLTITYFYEGNLTLPIKIWFKVFLLGALGIFAYQLFFAKGLSITTSVNTALMVAMSPIFTTLYAFLKKEQKVNRSIIIFILIGFLGTILISLGKAGGLSTSLKTVPGDLLVLTAAMFWAFYAILSQEILKEISAFKMTSYAMLTGGVLLWLVAAKDFSAVAWKELSLSAWIGLSYSTLIAACLVFILWAVGVKGIGTYKAMIYIYLQPLVALILGVLLLKEGVSWYQLIGGAIIIFSIVKVRSEKSETGMKEG